jgi:hypothetical protein
MPYNGVKKLPTRPLKFTDNSHSINIGLRYHNMGKTVKKMKG